MVLTEKQFFFNKDRTIKNLFHITELTQPLKNKQILSNIRIQSDMTVIV